MKVHAAVKALIQHKDKYLILTQTINGKQILDIPGGRIQHGESPYKALIREIKEDVNLDATIIKPLGAYWFFRAIDNEQVVCTTFLCNASNTNVDTSKNPDDMENITCFDWLTKDEILAKELSHESFRTLIEENL